MKNKIAGWLRSLAEKIAPRPVVVYPQDGDIQYEGQRYHLEALRQRRYIPGYGNDGAEIYIEGDVREYLATATKKYVETKHVEDEGGRYVEGRLLILRKTV